MEELGMDWDDPLVALGTLMLAGGTGGGDFSSYGGSSVPNPMDPYGLGVNPSDYQGGYGPSSTRPMTVKGAYDQQSFRTGKPYTNANPKLGNFQVGERMQQIRQGLGNAADAVDRGLGLTAVERGQRAAIAKGAAKVGGRTGRRMALNALGNPALRAGLKWAPVAGTALAAGDLILGKESFANKAMDATAMAAGAAIGGFAIPVVGAPLGATIGKMGSDATQWLFGDRLTPEQRKMEQMAIALRGGVA